MKSFFPGDSLFLLWEFFFPSDFFLFSNKMNSENQKTLLEETLENLILLDAELIKLKRDKETSDKKYNEERAWIEKNINNELDWGWKLRRKLTGIPPDSVIEEQLEKEIQKLEKLTPEERMRKHLKRIKFLREAEKNNWYCS